MISPEAGVRLAPEMVVVRAVPAVGLVDDKVVIVAGEKDKAGVAVDAVVPLRITLLALAAQSKPPVLVVVV